MNLKSILSIHPPYPSIPMICLSNLSIDPLYILINGSDLSAAQACCNSLLGHAILSLPQYVIMYFIHICAFKCTFLNASVFVYSYLHNLHRYPVELTSNYISFTRQRVCAEKQDNLFIGLLFVYDDGVVDSFHTANSMRSNFISIS